MTERAASPQTKSSDRLQMKGESRREAFVRHYLIHQNASRAYREAGFKDGPGTRQSAHRLLTSADIHARIQEEREKHLAALDVKLEHLLRRYRDIAFTDIAEIVGMHLGACRHCFGIDHAYQWRTPDEYETSLTKLRNVGRSATLQTVQPAGGFGYNGTLPPHPDCPECDGEGIRYIKIKDTRLLTNAERTVFAGVEETPYGINYRFNNQLAALKELAKRLGFYDQEKRNEPNVIARLLQELQSRGQMQRMPVRQDTDPTD